jgi:large subunit ribosomal protein L10
VTTEAFLCEEEEIQMPTEKKRQIVQELREEIARSNVLIGAEYQGLRVSEMGQLRRQLKAKGLQVRVVKNTLLKLAAESAEKPEVAELAEGPTAIVFGYGDEAETAKAIREYVQSARNAFAPRRAFAGGRILSARDLTDLALLPPRPVLLSRLAGGLQSGIARLAGLLDWSASHPTAPLLNSTLTQLGGLLSARAEQLERA